MDRSKGIGGSEWGHVLDIPPYGCRRRLWYQKTGVPEDFSPETTLVMERGTELEDIVARRWQREREKAGRRVRLVKPKIVPLRSPDWWIGHVDRLIHGDERGVGVLEIKTANQFVFRKIKTEGPPPGYAAQVLHYMHLHKCNWGVLVVLWPDGWEMIEFQFEFDAELHQKMLESGHEFMRHCSSGVEPERHPGDYPGCRSCPWRLTCQDVNIAPAPQDTECEVLDDRNFEVLLAQSSELSNLVKEAENSLQEVNAKIRESLGDRQAVQCGRFRVYYKPQTRVQIDTTRLRKEKPEVASEYEKTIVSRPLLIRALH